MRLVTPDMISAIDAYAEKRLDISTRALMERAGTAAASLVRRYVARGAFVVVLAGGGNNGGDGYALASELISDYSVAVYDVFNKGQRSEAGKYHLERYKSMGGVVNIGTQNLYDDLARAGCVVDAIFGTGFSGEYPPVIEEIAAAINRSCAVKIAVDSIIGVDAYSGRVEPFAPKMTATLQLSFIKCGIASYPARDYVGELILDTLGIPEEKIAENFEFSYVLTDDAWAISNLPERIPNSNKGTYGKALLAVGSERYKGAAHLALSAALRTGVGLVAHYGEAMVASELLRSYPEVIYIDSEKNALNAVSDSYGAILIGSGSGKSRELADLTVSLVQTEGPTVVIDADAINSIAEHYGKEVFKSAKRRVVLTPHPLEFSRISGIPLEDIQASRLTVAKSFAEESGTVLVLKGAGTVVTDGKTVYINSTGTSALAKAGSGDVLAGIAVSLIAQSVPPLTASALAAWLHGRAGDRLEKEYSSYGVTPSDLPKAAAKELARLFNNE